MSSATLHSLSLSDADRLLTFEVGRAVYALPITAVLEVAEADRVTLVPGLPKQLAAVMNWHGDALPLVDSGRLLSIVEAETPETPETNGAPDDVDGTSVEEQPADESRGTILRQNVLVISQRGDESACLGLPVDRVIGLVDGTIRPSPSPGVVVDRRPVDGRVVSVLDPRRLVARAEELIECAAA